MVDSCLLQYNCRTHAGAEHYSGYNTFKYRVLFSFSQLSGRTGKQECVSVYAHVSRRCLHSDTPDLSHPAAFECPGPVSHFSLSSPHPRHISLPSPSLVCLQSRPDPGQHQAGDLSPAGPGHRLRHTRNIITRHRILTVNHNARTIEDFSLIRKCTY